MVSRLLPMLGVCVTPLRRRMNAMRSGSAWRRWRAGQRTQASAGDAEAMPHPRENGCAADPAGGGTLLGLNSASGTRWMKIKIRCDGPQRKAQRFAHVCARAKTSGLPSPLTREPPRRRRIATHNTTSTPHFDMSATLADFCCGRTRPTSLPALSPAKAYSRSKREAAPSKQRRAAPVYADVVDVLATDAAGRKYGRRRCDDGAMYLGDFADALV